MNTNPFDFSGGHSFQGWLGPESFGKGGSKWPLCPFLVTKGARPGMPGAMPGVPGAMPMGNPCMGMAPMQTMQPGMPMSNAMPVPPPGG